MLEASSLLMGVSLSHRFLESYSLGYLEYAFAIVLERFRARSLDVLSTGLANRVAAPSTVQSQGSIVTNVVVRSH